MYDGVDIVTNNPIHSKGVEKFLNKHKIQYDNIVFEENKEKLGMYQPSRTNQYHYTKRSKIN